MKLLHFTQCLIGIFSKNDFIFEIRQPVGKYLLQICGTTPCQLRGASEIMRILKESLQIDVGETTHDGLFTLMEVECAGACVNSPVVIVNGDYYEDLTAESCMLLLKSLQDNKPLKPGPLSARKSCEPLKNKSSLNDENALPSGGGYPGFNVPSDL